MAAGQVKPRVLLWTIFVGEPWFFLGAGPAKSNRRDR